MRRTRRSKVEAFKWLGANEPLTKAVNQNYIGEETNAKLVSPQNRDYDGYEQPRCSTGPDDRIAACVKASRSSSFTWLRTLYPYQR
jgi:hypothetical protein